MHGSSLETMLRLIGEFLNPNEKLRILDVGAFDVNGTYRPLMAKAWQYVGCDLRAGPNVDLVQVGPYRIQENGGEFDVVISGQCLEHVERPWLLMPEIARMLRPGGLAILTAPWQYTVHRYPLDCWRILPDGMMILLQEADLMPVREPWIEHTECWAVARRNGRGEPRDEQVMLAIGLSAEQGDPQIEDRRVVLGKCVENARSSGLDSPPVIVISGEPNLVRAWPETRGLAILDAGINVGKKAGECRIVRAAMMEAYRRGAKWLLKVGGDTVHTQAGWGRAMLARLQGNGAAILTADVGNECGNTKVFLASVDALMRTWPDDAEVERHPPELGFERLWAANIKAHGVGCIRLPSREIRGDGQHWYVPTDPALHYEHAHCAASTLDWRVACHAQPGSAKDVEIAGVTIIHDQTPPEFIEQVISAHARHVEALYVLSNGNPPAEAVRAVEACPKVKRIVKTNPTFLNGRAAFVASMRLLDDVKPEIASFFDSDDIPPENVLDAIAEMKAHNCTSVDFPFLVCVGDSDHVIADISLHSKYHGAHVKVCVWRPGITFDSPRGFTTPGKDFENRIWHHPFPIRHLYVATPAAWRHRWQVKPQPWMLQPWRVAPYDPKTTWDEWRKSP